MKLFTQIASVINELSLVLLIMKEQGQHLANKNIIKVTYSAKLDLVNKHVT